jgi:Hypothetical protein (DUF2513)
MPMKRDMDLVRQILITIEDHEQGYAPETIDVPGYTHEVIGYHLVLMADAGLILANIVGEFGAGSPDAIVDRMTWDGHEFLANARNETVWKKVKGIVATKGGSVSFEVLKLLVTQAAKDYFLPGQFPQLPPTP